MKPFNTNYTTLGGCLRTAGIVLLIAFVLFYVHFQARNIIQGPELTLMNTLDTIQYERQITLSGTARNVVKLTLNGKEIHTDEQGAFTHTLILGNNYTVMSLYAEDRFGRKTSLLKEFIYVAS